MLHVKAFLPPDPTISAVPVLPVDNRKKTSGYSGAGIAPAENHVLLLEDEPSHCLREGMVWKLKEVDLINNEGVIVVQRERRDGRDVKEADEKMTFDAATRIWRGRECIGIEDLIAENQWPAEGTKSSLGGQSVQLGITWKPTPGVFSLASTSRIFGSMIRPCSALLEIKPRHIRLLSAVGGCQPGLTRSSMESLVAPR